jgi:hypothetical protein
MCPGTLSYVGVRVDSARPRVMRGSRTLRLLEVDIGHASALSNGCAGNYKRKLDSQMIMISCLLTTLLAPAVTD